METRDQVDQRRFSRSAGCLLRDNANFRSLINFGSLPHCSSSFIHKCARLSLFKPPAGTPNLGCSLPGAWLARSAQGLWFQRVYTAIRKVILNKAGNRA
jgi:hypothetical protein